MYGATNEEVHKTSDKLHFCGFIMILKVPGPPEAATKMMLNKTPKHQSVVSAHFWKLFWIMLAPKSDVCAFLWYPI